MKKYLSLLLAILFASGAVLCGCNGGTQTPADTTVDTAADITADTTADTTAAETATPNVAPSPSRDKNTELSILFIGNSFTYYNDMPTEYFEPICTTAGYKVKVESITKGGYYLSKFADSSDEYGKLVDKALKNNKYDVVILQEQSGCPIADRDRFFGGVRALAKKVEANGAELYLYQTWGYKEGYSKLASHGGTTKIMEMKLRAAYTAIADEVGAKVALVGVAMLDVHTNETIDLYRSDLFHPSKYGSALAAYTLFATIFNEDPRALSFNCRLGAPIGKILKDAAYSAAFSEHPVLDKYKITIK